MFTFITTQKAVSSPPVLRRFFLFGFTLCLTSQ